MNLASFLEDGHALELSTATDRCITIERDVDNEKWIIAQAADGDGVTLLRSTIPDHTVFAALCYINCFRDDPASTEWLVGGDINPLLFLAEGHRFQFWARDWRHGEERYHEVAFIGLSRRQYYVESDHKIQGRFELFEHALAFAKEKVTKGAT